MTLYVATFSDGTRLERIGRKRVFTHAYLVRGYYHPGPAKKAFERSGFSTSLDQVERNMRAETAWYIRSGGGHGQIITREIVETKVEDR